MMTPKRIVRAIEVLDAIATDMEADVSRDERLPFTAENVARSLGEIRAAVQALANIISASLQSEEGA